MKKIALVLLVVGALVAPSLAHGDDHGIETTVGDLLEFKRVDAGAYRMYLVGLVTGLGYACEFAPDAGTVGEGADIIDRYFEAQEPSNSVNVELAMFLIIKGCGHLIGPKKED